MYRALAAVVVALVAGAAGFAQSSQDPWPPPGVLTTTTPGVTRPVIVSQVPPAYTPIALREKIQGVVTVACVIEPDGTVGPARVVQSLDKQFGLDTQALAAAKGWRFKPGTKDGAPVRTLITINLIFSIKGEPPPSSWPALFTSDTPSQVDTSKWLEETPEGGKVRARVNYPPSWTAQPEGLLVLRSDDFLETVAILQARTLPGGLKQPLSIPDVQKFADIMRTSGAAMDLDSLGVGQALAGSHSWVWQEMHAPTSHMNRLVDQMKMPEAAVIAGMRFWHFTTAVNGTELLTVAVIRLIPAGLTAETIDADLRASGRIFDQILRRMTLSLR
jgi:TonB family protein